MPANPQNERIDLGTRLKEAREYVGLSQEEVARILKTSRSAICLIEKGERKVDALELKQLASLYQRKTDYFTGASPHEQLPSEIALLARAASGLTSQDVEELTRFAEFLRSRTKPDSSK